MMDERFALEFTLSVYQNIIAVYRLFIIEGVGVVCGVRRVVAG